MITTPTTQLDLSTEPVARVAADWLAVGVWTSGPFFGASAEVDAATGGLLARLRESGDITGKHLELVPVLNPTGLAAKRLLVVGLGKQAEATRGTIHDAAAAAARHVTGKKVGTVAFAVPSPEFTLAAGVGLAQGCQGPGIRKATPARFAPERLVLVSGDSAALPRARAEAQALWLARELVNTPPCDLYPESFADRAREVAKQSGVECTVLDEPALVAERMGALLGIARGSDRPPRLVVLRYRGGGGGPTLGLVGKGVTFDSGGLSLKTNEHMVDMKCDMAGAAAVLGAFQAAAALKLPANLLGVLALVENMPSGRALKLGDVLRARNGKTIEVLNTDAEGRLVLADVLDVALQHQPAKIIDLATLTGSCVVALGNDVAGLMTNNHPWADAVKAAARATGEHLWQLPMFPEYGEQIRSEVADIKNVGDGRWGGAITAAKFLEEFVGGKPWVHLDIAGPAFYESSKSWIDAGATGFGVRTLVEVARQM